MRLTFMPQTVYGRRSVRLAAASLMLGVAANLIATAQDNNIEYPNPINSPLLGTVLYLTFLVLFGAAITGYLAVRRQQERAVLVYLIILVGTAFFLGAFMLAVAGLFGSPG